MIAGSCVAKSIGSGHQGPLNLELYKQDPQKFPNPEAGDKDHGKLSVGERIVAEYRSFGNTIGRSPEEIDREYKAHCDTYRSQNNAFSRTHHHWMISHAGEDRTPRLVKEHAERAMSRFPTALWNASMHTQSKGEKVHVHIDVCSMGTDGKLIKTQKIWGRIRKASDEASKEMGLEILEAREHIAVKRESMAERKSVEDRGMELGITVLKKEAIEVFQRLDKTANVVTIRRELGQRGIELLRSGDDGGLMYRYGDRAHKASNLGDVFQLGGLAKVAEKGYDKAVAEIEDMGKEQSMKDLNRTVSADRDFGYHHLKDGQKSEHAKRDMTAITESARNKAGSVDQFVAVCKERGVSVSETEEGKFRYEYHDQTFYESQLSRMHSKADLEKHYTEQEQDKRKPDGDDPGDKGGQGGATARVKEEPKEERATKLPNGLEYAELGTPAKQKPEPEQTADIERGR